MPTKLLFGCITVKENVNGGSVVLQTPPPSLPYSCEMSLTVLWTLNGGVISNNIALHLMFASRKLFLFVRELFILTT